jgi:hypothetical protein
MSLRDILVLVYPAFVVYAKDNLEVSYNDLTREERKYSLRSGTWVRVV